MRIALLGVVALLAGCQMVPPMQPRPVMEPDVPFDAAALQAGMTPGHAIVKGQAFAKTVGGDVKYGAGNEIGIVPATAYSITCNSYLQYGANTTCGTKLMPYVRTVAADGEGRFEFDDLSPGKYLVFTSITWGVPTPYGIEQTGGKISGVVDISSDTDVVTAHLQ